MLSLASRQALSTYSRLNYPHIFSEKLATARTLSARRSHSIWHPQGPFDWTARSTRPPKPRSPLPRTSTASTGTRPDVDGGIPEADCITKAGASYADNTFQRLWTFIKDGKPKEALELYDQYRVQKGAGSSPETHPDSALPLAFDIGEPEKSSSSSSSDSHHRVVLAAVAAHAMGDSLEGAINVFLSAGTRWHASTASYLLQQLDYDKTLQNKITLYFEDVKIAHWLSNPAALSKHIKSLSKTRSIDAIWGLYQSIVQGITRPAPFIARDDIEPSIRPVRMTEIIWGSFLAAFLRCDRSDLASHLWKELEDLQVARSTGLWTTLLDGFDHLRISTPALAFWKSMHSIRVKPDALTYRAIISVCLRDNQVSIGLSKFQEFKTIQNQQDWSESHRRSVYNTVLDGLLLNQSLSQAMKLLEEMKSQGPAPDVVTYNVLLGYYQRRSDFTGIGKVMSLMDQDKIKGDVYTFSMLLSALLNAGREDAMDIVFDCMKEQGIKPNVAIYTTLIDNQLQSHTEASLRAVLDLLHRMETERVVLPNDVTYTAILTHIHRGRWLSPEQVAEYRQAVLRRMKAQGIQLNLPGYHTILKACFESSQDGAVQHALSYYQELKRRGIPLVQTTWYILLAGLTHHGEWELARQMVEDMMLSNIKPSMTLSRIVKKVLQRTTEYNR